MKVKFRGLFLTGIIFMSFLVLTGCRDDITILPESPQSGGTVDNTDYSAPKTIKSTELTAFELRCFIYERVDYEKSGRYDYKIVKNEDGSAQITESSIYDSTVTIDASVMDELQQIIVDNDLASLNGVSRYTSGLPDEFQLMYFTASYASGEKISFSVNNDPDSDWCWKVYDKCRKAFADAGCESAMYNEDDMTFVRFDMEYSDGISGTGYSQLWDFDPETGEADVEKITYSLWNTASDENALTETVDLPEGYYQGIAGLAEEIGILPYSNWQIAGPEFDKDAEPYISFTLEAVSGLQYNAFYSGEDIPPELIEAFYKVDRYMKDMGYFPESLSRQD